MATTLSENQSNLLPALLSSDDSLSMTSLEIAELVGARHDNVKRAVERLVEKGVIRQPPLEETEEINNLGLPRKVGRYVFTGAQGKRDSIIVVAQIMPELTARIVDRWIELEKENLHLRQELSDKERRLAIKEERRVQHWLRPAESRYQAWARSGLTPRAIPSALSEPKRLQRLAYQVVPSRMEYAVLTFNRGAVTIDVYDKVWFSEMELTLLARSYDPEAQDVAAWICTPDVYANFLEAAREMQAEAKVALLDRGAWNTPRGALIDLGLVGVSMDGKYLEEYWLHTDAALLYAWSVAPSFYAHMVRWVDRIRAGKVDFGMGQDRTPALLTGADA